MAVKSACARTRGERSVEIGKRCGRQGAAPTRQGIERRIEAGTQIEPASDVAKLDYLGPHQKRRRSCERCNGCA